jgi:pimeloyl-ACP methyl ester carboxylesterase
MRQRGSRCGWVLLIAALALAGCGGQSRPKAVKARSLPGSVVVADGHKVYFDCKGKGSPTVVFLSGWGVDSSGWLGVLDGTSRVTRSCEYDRYGTGFTSTYGSLPRRARDAHDQLRELEQLLRNADMPKPYVLVGHSWGGALARLYAGTHDDVEAVVLVDASSPGQNAAIAAVLPPKKRGEAPLLEELRHPHVDAALANPEYLAWEKSLNETGEVKTLGDLPLIVVTAATTFAGFEDVVFPVWMGLQNRLASLSSGSVHVLARASGHFVQVDQPDVVQAAVRAAVNAARNDGRLASCVEIFRRVGERTCLH